MQALQPTLKSNPNAKPMIQSHDKLFIKSPVLIGNIKKAQFSLAKSKSLVLTSDKNKNKIKIKTHSYQQYQENLVLTSNIKKPSSHWQKKIQFSLAISRKLDSHWQYQENLVLTSNIKNPIYVGTILSKAQDY